MWTGFLQIYEVGRRVFFQDEIVRFLHVARFGSRHVTGRRVFDQILIVQGLVRVSRFHVVVVVLLLRNT